jgi:hypothetical protein
MNSPDSRTNLETTEHNRGDVASMGVNFVGTIFPNFNLERGPFKMQPQNKIKYLSLLRYTLFFNIRVITYSL